MSSLTIILAGCGNMAQAVVRVCGQESKWQVEPFEVGRDYELDFRQTVALHFGSGRQLPALLAWCEQFDVPLIQGSTGLDLPAGNRVETLYVDAPNLCLPIVKFLRLMNSSVFRDTFRGMSAELSESHQQTKKSVPGTALRMADSLGVDPQDIMSIRNTEQQRTLGIPEAYLDGHGYHYISLSGFGARINISTEVNGRDAYVLGALEIAGALLDNRGKLNKRVCRVEDVLNYI